MANQRARVLASEIRLRRQLGVAGRRRRIPKQKPPRMVEREYLRALRLVLKRLENSLEPLIEALPELTRRRRQAILKKDARQDAGETREALRLLREAIARANVPEGPLEALALRIATQVRDHQGREFRRQVQAALGIDIWTDDTGLQDVMGDFVTEQVKYITELPRRVVEDIEGVILRDVPAGKLHTDIAEDIARRLDIGKRKAALIARDQVGKFYGRVNRERQQSAGFGRYRWQTVGDERVRPEHEARDGRIYSWDDPPSDGHPGEPVNCRCFPEPVFEDVLEEV